LPSLSENRTAKETIRHEKRRRRWRRTTMASPNVYRHFTAEGAEFADRSPEVDESGSRILFGSRVLFVSGASGAMRGGCPGDRFDGGPGSCR